MTKHYFGITSIILASACLIWSIGQAGAFPQGPNISMGSNPVDSFQVTCPNTILTTTSQEFVITDIRIGSGYYSNDSITLSTQNETLIKLYNSNDGNVFVPLQSGIKIPVNETLSCSITNSNAPSYSKEIFISGYYAH